MRNKASIDLIWEEIEKEMIYFLESNGYKSRNPVLIKNPDSFRIQFNDYAWYSGTNDGLRKLIKESKRGMTLEEHKTVQEWLQHSCYKHFFRKQELKKKLNRTHSEKKQVIEKELAKLNEIIDKLSCSDIIKKELAYRFEEEGERIDELFNRFHSFSTLEKTEIGNFRVEYTANCKTFTTSLKGIEGDFFQELWYMYEGIKGFNPQKYFSEKAGEMYSTERIFVVRTDQIRLKGEKKTMEGIIERDGIEETLECSIQVQPVKVTNRDICLNLGTIQGYAIYMSKEEGVLVARNDELAVIKEETCPNSIIVMGEPEVLEKKGLDIIESLL